MPEGNKFIAVDFFCGGGGMTCGLKQAGIEVIAGVDLDGSVKETYERNNGATFIQSDIRRLRSNYFERKFGLKKNEDRLIMVGCSPCQYYSIINTDRSKSQKTKALLMSFARFVEYYRPGFVLVENVPGIVYTKDSILPKFINKLSSIGYSSIKKGVLDLSFFGVPQSRKRFSLIATRLNVELSLPSLDNHRSVVEDFIGEHNGFPPIPAGFHDESPFQHSCAGLDEKSLRRMRMTPHDGGGRLAWAHDPDLQLKCYIGKDNSFKDTYGRMWWKKPSPTITTKFFSVSSGRFSHPVEDRPISIREGATLQTFPKSYIFYANSISGAAKMIGNAVPCEFARRIGSYIQSLI